MNHIDPDGKSIKSWWNKTKEKVSHAASSVKNWVNENKTTLKKIAIGVAVIATAAILTVATGGAAGGVLGYIAAATFKGAVIGAISGTVIGATTQVISNRVETGSWENSGQATFEGAADGFMKGTVLGAATGALTSTIQVAHAASAWSPGTGRFRITSLSHHYHKHVISEAPWATRNIITHTKDALNFIERNADILTLAYNYKYHNLEWTSNYIGQGGKFTTEGLIYSFWYVKTE